MRRDRDSNSGTKKIGHSLAGCCITTLPPLQDLSALLSRACDLPEGKNSEILSPTTRQVEGVCILATRDGVWPSLRSQKLNNTMKKFLFLGAFAIFALTASAQSTEAPADKKAKTEQTCSKDQKASCDKSKSAGCCSKGASASTDGKGASCDKSKSAGCCSKGASASTDGKGASCSKSSSAGCCSKGAAADAGDKKSKKSKKRGGNKTSGLSSGH